MNFGYMSLKTRIASSILEWALVAFTQDTCFQTCSSPSAVPQTTSPEAVFALLSSMLLFLPNCPFEDLSEEPPKVQRQ